MTQLGGQAVFDKKYTMKKIPFVLALCFALAATLILGGCVAAIGNHPPNEPTVGQQLIDLQKAKDSGAMSDAEYQAEKAKVLGHK